MSVKPILFNEDDVRATLEDRKHAIRRVIKPQPDGAHTILDSDDAAHTFDFLCGNGGSGGQFVDWVKTVTAPYWPGDILWARETWGHPSESEISRGANPNKYLYKADTYQPCAGDKWHPSIHMPKEAARLFLRVTDVWAERLFDSFTAQGDTIAALLAEGIDIGDHCRQCINAYGNPCCNDLDPELEPDESGEDENGGSECGVLDGVRSDFARLWDSCIPRKRLPLYGWDANPWVWVIEFERISKEAALAAQRRKEL